MCGVRFLEHNKRREMSPSLSTIRARSVKKKKTARMDSACLALSGPDGLAGLHFDLKRLIGSGIMWHFFNFFHL